MFDVEGKPRRFHKGQYTTEDAKEIAVLEKLQDVERVDEKPVKKTAK